MLRPRTPSKRRDSPPRARARRAARLLAPAILLLSLETAGAARRPGPAPQPGRGRIARNTACVGCHPDIAAEWSASLHRAAADDPEYLRAHAREPRRFCRACHVPEAMPDRPPDPAAEAIGVACVTCHWAGPDAVLAAPGPTTAAARAAHRVVESIDMAGPAACADCHEFPFPDQALRARPAFMQRTAAEHRASWAADYACADCHMPWVDAPGGGHRSHRFDGSRSPAAAALALGVAATRRGPDTVDITLTPGAAGHAFPTGDLFRRLEVRVEPLAPGRAIPPQIRHLGRRFADGQELPGFVVRREIADDRITDRPVTLHFTLPDAAPDACEDPSGLWIAYRVSYQRVADAHGGTIEGELVLAEGLLLPWEPTSHE